MALSFGVSFAHAQDLPQGDIITQGVPGAVAEATHQANDVLEIHSSGYSRFEIADDGDIVVVYSGGVEFKYLGYQLRADELHFDQAARRADISGNVQFSSPKFALSTQQITLDGTAGSGFVSGHIVGILTDSGVRFEADSAQITFPPESDQPRPEETQLVLSGNVAVHTRDGAELRTDQVALDGATRRFSSAPFTLAIPLRGKAGQPASTIQVTGTAFGGTLTDKGQPMEVDILGLLAVSAMGRFSAERAVAHPTDATGQAWQVDLTGSPVRLEYAAPLMLALSPKQPEANVGPALLEAQSATLALDGAGLKSASLGGGVTIVASGLPLGNRLSLDNVSLDRRADGMAFGAGGLSLGLDLAHLLGIEPVDLTDLIK